LLSKYPLSVYRQLNGWPTFQTLHGPGLFCGTGWGCLRKNSGACELGVGAKCYTRGCVSLAAVPLLIQLHARMLRLAKRTVDRFLCPSRQLLETVRRFGLSRSEYVPIGIDPVFCSVPPASHVGPPIILFVGGLVPVKGPDVLMRAFVALKARLHDLRLRFAGRGPLLASLQEKAIKAGVARDVEFLGFVDHANLVTQYRQAHVVVVPSIWQEQFGLIGPEALACGTPCVGTDIGGIREWLHDGKWGFLFPPRDAAALEEKLSILLYNRDLRTSFGLRGRAFVLENYGPERYGNNHVRIVKEYLQ
jgi:glycosyltransferase involved in cell wall biosynthesis